MTLTGSTRLLGALAGYALCSVSCILDDIPDRELGRLSPPCARGWVVSPDGMQCVRPGEVDETDAGEPDSGMTDGMVDAGDSGETCFDPQSGTAVPDASVPDHPVINEYVFVHAEIGTRNIHFYEFVEVYGPPSTDLSDLTLVLINSHSGGNFGRVESITSVGQTNLAGFWQSCVGWEDELDAFRQASTSMFLVRDFTGFVGEDLDGDDDGTLDRMPWSAVVDALGFQDGDAADDVFYALPVLTNDGFPGHEISGGRSLAARTMDGVDTDAEEDWRKVAFGAFGLPDVMGAPRPTEAWATPGKPNFIQP